jgi:hypothetical protein
LKLGEKRGGVLSSEQTTELRKQLKGEEPMPTDNVAKKRGKAKIKISEKRKAAMERIVDSYSEDFDVKMTVIQELIPLGFKAVAEELQDEVRRLAGTKHSRDGNITRWGRQNGSVYLRARSFRSKFHAFATSKPERKLRWRAISGFKNRSTTTEAHSEDFFTG